MNSVFVIPNNIFKILNLDVGFRLSYICHLIKIYVHTKVVTLLGIQGFLSNFRVKCLVSNASATSLVCVL